MKVRIVFYIVFVSRTLTLGNFLRISDLRASDSGEIACATITELGEIGTASTKIEVLPAEESEGENNLNWSNAWS